jgi:hypothetical protein
LEFNYLNAQIQKICEKRQTAVAELGEAAALDLERTLADIDACDHALDFRALYVDIVEELSPHRWAVRLAGGCNLELASAHVGPRLTKTGVTDWGKVTRLRIEAVGGRND